MIKWFKRGILPWLDAHLCDLKVPSLSQATKNILCPNSNKCNLFGWVSMQAAYRLPKYTTDYPSPSDNRVT